MELIEFWWKNSPVQIDANVIVSSDGGSEDQKSLLAAAFEALEAKGNDPNEKSWPLKVFIQNFQSLEMNPEEKSSPPPRSQL